MSAIHVVSVSSGASSAVCAKRVIEKYDKENVRLVFADTLIEDIDNYRFLADLERVLDTPIIHLQEGRNPYELFADEHLIPNNMIAPCTFKLKTVLIENYVQSLGGDVVMYIGFDYKDRRPRPNKPNGRLDAPVARWAKLGVTVEYPLLWQPIEYNALATLISMGIEPPEMYAKGYSHANCGGCCVKQGMGDWRRTLLNYPERYAKIEAWEKDMRTRPETEGYTILRRDGERLTLEQLRLETESANPRQMRMFAFQDDAGNVCGVECGVGGGDE